MELVTLGKLGELLGALVNAIANLGSPAIEL